VNAFPVRPEVERAVRAGRALAARLEGAVGAAARARTPREQAVWRRNVHRRSGRLEQWAAAVRAQLVPRVDELNVRELDFLSNALGRAARALERANRGTPVSIRTMQRAINPRLRLPPV
jgi:hypothetical protein